MSGREIEFSEDLNKTAGYVSSRYKSSWRTSS